MKKSMIKKFSIVIVLAVILSGITNVFIFDSNFALEKVPIHLENSIITGIKIA